MHEKRTVAPSAYALAIGTIVSLLSGHRRPTGTLANSHARLRSKQLRMSASETFLARTIYPVYLRSQSALGTYTKRSSSTAD